MIGMVVFSSHRRESRRKSKKTSIGRNASRSKMNKGAARSYKKYRSQGR